jgi:intein/homing endonuclease
MKSKYIFIILIIVVILVVVYFHGCTEGLVRAPQPTAKASPGKGTSCFANDSIIYLENGETKRIEDAEVGDKILSYNSKNAFVYSPIVAIPHPKNNILSEFVVIKTANNKTIKATGQHLIPIMKNDKLELVEANNIQIDDLLVTVDGNETVVSKDTVEKSGIYTVITVEDYIVVDNIVVSPYTYPYASYLLGIAFQYVFRKIYSIDSTVLQSKIFNNIVKSSVDLCLFFEDMITV